MIHKPVSHVTGILVETLNLLFVTQLPLRNAMLRQAPAWSFLKVINMEDFPDLP
jgi:hypothetical protein